MSERGRKSDEDVTDGRVGELLVEADTRLIEGAQVQALVDRRQATHRRHVLVGDGACTHPPSCRSSFDQLLFMFTVQVAGAGGDAAS